MRRELGIGIVVAWCAACGSSRGDGGDTPGTGATGSGATGGSAGAGGSAGGSAGSSAGAGAQSGSGGATGGGAGSGGMAGSTGGASGTAGAGASAGMSGACPSETTNHVGGTRIRRKFAVTSEGVRAWVGWHDSVLDMDCEFSRASDGSYRCLPSNWSGSGEYFTDDACTQAAYTSALVDQCTPAPYLRTYVPAAGCGSTARYDLYEMGAAVPGGMPVYTRSTDGTTCSPTAVPADAPLYRRGAAVSPTIFMEGATAIVPDVGRIGERIWTTTDGLRQLAGWTDSARNDAECRFDNTKDGAVRCIPAGGRRINETFADAACTTHALEAAPLCDGSTPTIAMLYPDGECAGTGAYEPYAVGAELSGAIYSGGGDNACMEKLPNEGDRAFAVTPIPSSEFMEVTQRVEMSAPGRLKPSYRTSSDGGCWFNDFWDSELMASCWFSRTSQNEYRCLPGEYVQTVSLYLDSACTQSVAGYDRGTCQSQAAPRFVAGTSSTDMDECSDGIVPLETAPFDVPVYRLTAGTCTLVSDSSTLVRVTPADPARFVAGTVMVE